MIYFFHCFFKIFDLLTDLSNNFKPWFSELEQLLAMHNSICIFQEWIGEGGRLNMVALAKFIIFIMEKHWSKIYDKYSLKSINLMKMNMSYFPK